MTLSWIETLPPINRHEWLADIIYDHFVLCCGKTRPTISRGKIPDHRAQYN